MMARLCCRLRCHHAGMSDDLALDETKTLILVDGMALAYRGHFALIRNPRLTAAGLNTSAVFVFANVLLELLSEHGATHLAVVFDTKEPTFRHERYPEYKANREAMPEDLAAALPYLDQLCEALCVPVLKAPGWEADDVIGTLAGVAEDQGFDVAMVTPDKDYAQLVTERATMLKPKRGGGGFDRLTPGVVCEDWGVERVEQVVDVLGLMGDTSDNVPGVPGIGQKTAAKLIAEYDSVENLLEHTDELKGKRRENLENNRELALLSKELVTISREAPLSKQPDELIVCEPNQAACRELFAELEFRTLYRRLFNGAELDDEVTAPVELTNISAVDHDYRLVTSADEQAAVIAQALEQPAVCLDLETTGLDSRTCEVVGIALSWQAHTGFYLAVTADDHAAALERLRPLAEHSELTIVGHNLKFDATVLAWHGVSLRGRLWDTMLAAALLFPGESHTMDHLAERLLHYQPVKIETLIGPKPRLKDDPPQRSMRDLPPAEVCEYAVEDADITWQLHEAMQPLLDEHQQRRVFDHVESPLLPCLIAVEHTGIKLEPTRLAAMADELGAEAERCRERVFELAGHEFNLNSPKQLGVVLFDEMALDLKAKKTRTGQYQTNEAVLTRLAARHEIAQQILDYRLVTKLKSTYVDTLPTFIDERTGRIHSTFEQAVTATGRLASHNPNLQNIPIRGARGKEIRQAFVPEPGMQLLAADYSQIELRIAAEMSGDQALADAFRSGTDIHTATAMVLYDCDEPDEVDGDMRRQAKTVNFGILYGISAFGLSERSELSRAEAADLINLYFERFSALKGWMESVVERATETGYVETLTGRRRYLPDLQSRNGTARKAAERTAINAPVQGTAADLIKIAMGRIHTEMTRNQYRSRMVLQVHDELVFEVADDELVEVRGLIERHMLDALPLNVPLEVEIGVGPDWLTAH